MKQASGLLRILLVLSLPGLLLPIQALGASPDRGKRIAAPGVPYEPIPEDQYLIWNGIYAGLGAGTLVGLSSVGIEEGGPVVDGLGNWGFTGDVKVGYDYRFPSTPFVLGLFGGYSLGQAELGSGLGEGSSITPTWNAGARAGVISWNNALWYAGYKYQVADIDVPGVGGDTIGGHGVILGIEVPWSKNFTMGLEYGYTAMDSTVIEGLNLEPEIHSVMLRGNLRLGTSIGQ